MSESAARITLSAKGLIMKIFGDVLIIETSDPDELRREVNRALCDEPLTVQGAAGYLKVSTRTIRNWIKGGKLAATQLNGAGYRIQKRDLEQIQTFRLFLSQRTPSEANASKMAPGDVAPESGD